MCFFKKTGKTIHLKSGQSAIIFSNDGFEGYIDPQGEQDGTATYVATLVTWLLLAEDSDARLLYQAVTRKLDEKLDAYKKGIELKEARDGSPRADNRV